MFAVTERLLLRPGWPEDAHALVAALGDREVVRNLARVPWPYGLGDAAALLEVAGGHSRPERRQHLQHVRRPQEGLR